ncbi:MAG: glycosyltransferase family 4 protein [Nitrospinae bacterium]|nr:glycosyltransferase family 4 protein [Nitrospinota bacterium]
MKIAIVRQKYAIYGGAENFSSEYAVQLAREGHEVHIFANQWVPLDLPNIHFHKVPALGLNSFFRQLTFAWAASRLVRRERFDIVQSHERIWSQDIYRAGDGCHKEWLERRSRGLPPWKRWTVALSPFHWLVLKIERAIFTGGGCKTIVAISDMVKRDIQKHYRVPDGDIAVVYNGVSLEKFNPANRALYGEAVREKFNVPKDALLLLFVGSGFERKGLEYLVRALEYLKGGEWRLLAVGKGDWARYLRWVPEKVRDRIVCLAPVRDIEKYYAAGDVFVLPSIYEPFGNAYLEAMASGLPVVASRCSGAADIVRHKRDGLIVENPADPREIAENINYLFDPAIRGEMGRQARQLAENFTPEKTVATMVRIYKEIASLS